MIAHNVYFTLVDKRPETVKAMVDDCHEYLADLPGIVFYAAGTPVQDDSAGNDGEYDVALHIVLTDLAALQAYMKHPRHRELIAKHRSNWKDVVGFDSEVSGK
jgi:hypothetical protein